MINFDIIHHRCHGDPMQNDIKYYKTIKKNDLKNILFKEKALSAAICCQRKDLWVQRQIIIEHLKTVSLKLFFLF